MDLGMESGIREKAIYVDAALLARRDYVITSIQIEVKLANSLRRFVIDSFSHALSQRASVTEMTILWPRMQLT